MKIEPKLKAKLKIAGVLMALIIVLLVITGYPGFIERFYSGGVYLIICHILHPVLNIFPFSVGDVFYIGLIIYGIYSLVRLIRLTFKKQFALAGILLLKLFIVFETLYIVFYLFWGLNYFRPSAAKRLGLQDTSYTFTDVKTVTAMLIDSTNASKAALSNADTLQTNDQIYQNAVIAVKGMTMSKNFPAVSPHVKPSMLSFLLGYVSTSGYYNPFTSEAQIDYLMPYFLRPFVACHEMSHQMGFGAEDEADFSGYVTGISSRDRLLRYSAYFEATQEFLHTVGRQDTIAFHQLRAKLSKPVLADYKTERLYWKLYEGRLGKLTSLFYDDFLKANNQPHGIKTYNRMIRLCMAWYRKKDRRL